MKISILKYLSHDTSYIIIPFLESTYKKYRYSVLNMINNGIDSITLDDKYKDACIAIDEKFRDNLINIATITVSLTIRTKSKKTQKKSSKTETLERINLDSLGTSLKQIYLIRVDSDISNIKDKNRILEELRICGHLIFSILKNNFIKNVNLVPSLECISLNIKESISALLEGIMLSSYKFDKYKTDKALERQESKRIYHLENLYLIAQDTKHITDEINRLENIVASVFLAKDLINEPANDNKIIRFVARLNEFINKMHVPVELDIWNKTQLKKMGMGLILGVGKGSSSKNEPCILIVKYHPKNTNIPDWVLLGKGITFDTGGLNIKNPKHMLEMKSDLSGAAAVISFLLGYAANHGEKCIYAICPFAENSISSNAVKPSDVITAYDGRTVEVVDTDAEGRLVLADVISYTVEKWPTARILDLATLTGQAEDISGKAFSCILSVNADIETLKLIKISHVINEVLVRLPFLEKELNKLESNIADIKNVSYKSSADIIMSSLFIQQFIKPYTKWIHIDIAGPSFHADEIIKYASPEASGVGVRLLFEYFNK